MIKSNTKELVGIKEIDELCNFEIAKLSDISISLRVMLRNRADKLLDVYMAKHRALSEEAVLLGHDPSYLQFFVVFHKNVLELRWGVRTGRTSFATKNITKFLKKDAKYGYSKTTLSKVSKSWDRSLVLETEDQLRDIRKASAQLTEVKRSKLKLQNSFQKILEVESA